MRVQHNHPPRLHAFRVRGQCNDAVQDLYVALARISCLSACAECACEDGTGERWRWDVPVLPLLKLLLRGLEYW